MFYFVLLSEAEGAAALDAGPVLSALGLAACGVAAVALLESFSGSAVLSASDLVSVDF